MHQPLHHFWVVHVNDSSDRKKMFCYVIEYVSMFFFFIGGAYIMIMVWFGTGSIFFFPFIYLSYTLVFALPIAKKKALELFFFLDSILFYLEKLLQNGKFF